MNNFPYVRKKKGAKMKKEVTNEKEKTNVVEVVKGEVENNNINSCTKEEKRLFKKLCGNIDKALDHMDKEFLNIACAIWEINHKSLFRAEMYKNIVDCIKDKYGMQRSSTYAYIGIVDTFFKIDEETGHPVSIEEKWKDFSVSKLTAILSAPVEILDDFEPNMTVREIVDMINRAKEMAILEKESVEASTEQMELSMNAPEDGEEQEDDYDGLDVAPDEKYYRISSFLSLDELDKLKDVLSQTLNDFKSDKKFEGKKFHYEISLCWD